MAYNYTREEINALVASLNSRINTVSGSCDTVGGNISSHLTDPNAHNAIISPKEDSSRVDGLADRVNALASRVNTLEMHAGLNGTTQYTLTGSVGDSIYIPLDIVSPDSSNPVQYEAYTDPQSTLTTGLTFDPVRKAVSGVVSMPGTSRFTVLAKSGNKAVFINIDQSFNNLEASDERYTGLQDVVAKLRSGNVSDLVVGSEYTIKLADIFGNYTSKSFYVNGVKYHFARSYGKVNGMYKAVGSSNSFLDAYFDEIALFAGALAKDINGNVIGTVDSTPEYMKDYKIVLTSIDTDVPSSGNYAHNARFEFYDQIYDRDTYNLTLYNGSGLQQFLNSDSDYNFLCRIPSFVRNLFIPVNLKSLNIRNNSTQYAAVYMETLSNQKCFLPSTAEMGLRNVYASEMMDADGVPSTLYSPGVGPTDYNDIANHKLLIKKAGAYPLRTPVIDERIGVTSGNRYVVYGAFEVGIGGQCKWSQDFDKDDFSYEDEISYYSPAFVVG